VIPYFSRRQSWRQPEGIRGSRRTPPGGRRGQKAKDVIDAVAAADALEEKKDERK
jgi:hypothetical protein